MQTRALSGKNHSGEGGSAGKTLVVRCGVASLMLAISKIGRTYLKKKKKFRWRRAWSPESGLYQRDEATHGGRPLKPLIKTTKKMVSWAVPHQQQTNTKPPSAPLRRVPSSTELTAPPTRAFHGLCLRPELVPALAVGRNPPA